MKLIENRLLYNTKYYDSKLKCKIVEKDILKISKELENKNKFLQDHLVALEILYILRTKKISEKRKLIIDMLTTGCQDIFQKNYKIDILSSDEEEKTKNKDIKYNIILYKDNIEVARNEKLIISSGGGVLSVFSFLLKIIINLIYTKEKFFIFDESMTQVSKKYQPRLSKFLHELCKKQEITLVLITHMEFIKQFADNSYHLVGGLDKDGETPLLEIENKTKISTYPYYKLHLVNFQSIKNLTFDFAGFTVITGENDIGKSTITRSLNSILYNDFDNIFIRRNIKKGEKCIIEFSKYLSDNNIAFNMKLEASKSNGITYSMNGEEFRGKKLSKDAIEKELSKNGFGSFIEQNALTSFSKDKKKKIANLVVTNQNDQLYLLDNTNSENNKIISYIFQASTINEAILKLKDKIKELKNNNKLIENNLNELKIKYLQLSKEKDIYYKKYFLEILILFKEYKKELNNFSNKKLINLKNNIKLLILLITYKIKKLEYFKLDKYNVFFIDKKENINKKLKNIKNQLNLLLKYKHLNNYLNNLHLLNNIDIQLSKYKNFKINLNNNINKIDKLIKKYKKLQIILNYQNSYMDKKNNLLIIKNNLLNYYNKKEIVNKKINLIKLKIDNLKQIVLNIETKEKKLIKLIELSDNYFYKIKQLNIIQEELKNLYKIKERIIKTKQKLIDKYICPTCKGTGYYIS